MPDAPANESPAETIRRAAQLMRERANAATPGPWNTHWYQEAVDGPYAIATTGGGYIGGGVWHAEDAAHIASWHPAVALPIADLLTTIAKNHIEGYVSSDWRASMASRGDIPHPMCTYCGDLWQCAEHRIATAIARTYLGETDA